MSENVYVQAIIPPQVSNVYQSPPLVPRRMPLRSCMLSTKIQDEAYEMSCDRQVEAIRVRFRARARVCVCVNGYLAVIFSTRSQNTHTSYCQIIILVELPHICKKSLRISHVSNKSSSANSKQTLLCHFDHVTLTQYIGSSLVCIV